jgi:hypothetical protein
MTSDRLANSERLRATLENREAIYVERGALRVKVTNIRANAVVQAMSADIEEILSGGISDLDRFGRTDQLDRTEVVGTGDQRWDSSICARRD